MSRKEVTDKYGGYLLSLTKSERPKYRSLRKAIKSPFKQPYKMNEIEESKNDLLNLHRFPLLEDVDVSNFDHSFDLSKKYPRVCVVDKYNYICEYADCSNVCIDHAYKKLSERNKIDNIFIVILKNESSVNPVLINRYKRITDKVYFEESLNLIMEEKVSNPLLIIDCVEATNIFNNKTFAEFFTNSRHNGWAIIIAMTTSYDLPQHFIEQFDYFLIEKDDDLSNQKRLYRQFFKYINRMSDFKRIHAMLRSDEHFIVSNLGLTDDVNNIVRYSKLKKCDTLKFIASAQLSKNIESNKHIIKIPKAKYEAFHEIHLLEDTYKDNGNEFEKYAMTIIYPSICIIDRNNYRCDIVDGVETNICLDHAYRKISDKIDNIFIITTPTRNDDTGELIVPDRYKRITNKVYSIDDFKLIISQKVSRPLMIIDCINKQNVRDAIIVDFIFHHRHKGWALIFIMPFPFGISPEMRANFDYVLVGKEDFISVQKKLYEHYFGIYPNFAIFKQVFDSLDKNEHFIIVQKGDQTCDRVRYSKLKKTDTLKFIKGIDLIGNVSHVITNNGEDLKSIIEELNVAIDKMSEIRRKLRGIIKNDI
jgi:hypothetical protein